MIIHYVLIALFVMRTVDFKINLDLDQIAAIMG